MFYLITFLRLMQRSNILYDFVHDQFAKPIVGECVPISVVVLLVSYIKEIMNFSVLRNNNIVILTVLSYCITNFLLPSLKGYRSL